MIRPLLFCIVSLWAQNLLNAQELPLTEFDLYGCWILERNEDGTMPQERIYKRCAKANSKRRIHSSRIALLPFNKSEIQTTSHYVCFTTVTEKGTWEFDKVNRTIHMYWGEELLKEFKEKAPKEYAEFNSPEKFEWMKFKIISFSGDCMETERIPRTK